MTNSIDGGPHRFMDLPNWTNRHPVTAAMLNPAAVALSIAAAAERYSTKRGEPLPWEYGFITVPLAFHRGTRQSLPVRATAHWSRWVADNPALIAGFAQRAIATVPYVREGLRFGLRGGSLALDSQGGLEGQIRRSPILKESAELRELVQKSAFIGGWFERVDRPSTLFTLLGVAP